MTKVKKDSKPKKANKNFRKKNVEDNVGLSGQQFVDMSDELGGDEEDLTSAYARSRVVADDSWDVVSTDDDDDGIGFSKNPHSEYSTEEEQLDAIIADYAGVDGLAPEKANEEKK